MLTMLRLILVCVLLGLPLTAAAFPSTPILDTFSQANEDPLSSSGNWSGPIFPGINQMKVVSNGIMQSMTVANQSGASYWAATNFGPGSEVYFDVPTVWANNASDVWTWCNGQNENTASVDGYTMVAGRGTGSWVWTAYRVDNGSWTQLGASLGTQTLSSGDSVGIECGPTGILQAYYKASGGSWTTIGTTRTDTTYTSGHIGLSKGYLDVTSVVDNFGGGNMSTLKRFLLLGVGQ